MFGASGSWDTQVGPCVEVGLFAGRDWEHPEDIPRFQALIDTGAEATCISRTAAALLGIRDMPVSIRRVTSPGGSADLNVYEIHLVFFVSPTYLQIREMEVMETKSDSPDWDVLLGRDVLKQSIFTMDFSGRFAIALT